MDKEKLRKGYELVEQHERYDKLASMLSMLIDCGNDGEPMVTPYFKLAIIELSNVYKDQYQRFEENDLTLIKDLIRVVREHDSKVLKEFEEL